jgi:diacylglycerol kinase (ATP)
MRLLFVINPVSGAGQTDWHLIIGQWLNEQAQHTGDFYIMQEGTDNVAQLKAQLDRLQADRLVVAGGDGTVKMAAEILIDKQVPLAIIPAGSANGMAKELGIPADVNKALALAVNGEPSPLDMIRINDEWCIHLSDIGLNAKMLRHFEESGERGKWGYLKAFFKSWGSRSFMRVTIKTDEGQFERKAMMVVMANASKYGTGAVINPRGKPDDGLFEVVIVRRLPVAAILNMLILGRPFDPANIEILCCHTMELTTTHAYPFQVDGEYRGKQKRVTATIRQKAIQVIAGDM